MVFAEILGNLLTASGIAYWIHTAMNKKHKRKTNKGQVFVTVLRDAFRNMSVRPQKGRIVHFVVLFFWVVIHSCSPVNYLQVQTGIPGEKDLPSAIQSLTLINRTRDSLYQDLSRDSLQRLFYKRQFQLDTVVYDLTAVDTVIRALGELMYESGRYDIIIPEDRFLPHKKNAFISEPMPWNQVVDLCQTFQTDAVLSLDYFKTSISTNYKSETLYDHLEDNYFRAYMAVMAIQYEALFRVYDPEQQKIVDQTIIKDTLWWDDTDVSTRTLFQRLTPVKNALVESGIAIALDYSDKICPDWRSARRKYFYKGNTLFEEAHAAVKNNNWEEALKIWLLIAEQATGKSLRSKAEYNVALAYEMLGDINQAIRWGLRSYETYYHPITVEYLNILKNRKQEIEKYSRNER
jgi:hypothetical protein